MTIFLVVAYVIGWIVTTVVLLRHDFAPDATSRGHRAVLGVVSAVCALALAAVWPISGWFLPMIRAAMDDSE